jgi:hypothetical protein
MGVGNRAEHFPDLNMRKRFHFPGLWQALFHLGAIVKAKLSIADQVSGLDINSKIVPVQDSISGTCVFSAVGIEKEFPI